MHRLRGRTALTLYENEGCGDGPRELSPVAWAERYVPVRVRSGLDDVLLSYYEPQCEGRRPSPGEWTRRSALRRLFPRARVGFGEIGLPKAATPSTRATAASIIAYYYGLRIALPYFVGGGFYWYFAEDMVPRSGSPLWAALARAWLGTGARLRRAPRASADIAPPPHAGFSYQIGGPFAPAPGVGVVDRDRHAAPAPGTYGICYVNGFQAQPEELGWWRARHPSLLLRRGGRAVLDTSWNEQLLDISAAAKRRAVAAIVGDWIRSCARAGYRAVELDNLDSFARSRGILTAADNLALARLLIARAHSAGLAIAQKNGAELVRTGRRLGFDFAIAEECQAYGECGRYLGAYGDRVIEVEYPDNGGKRNFDRACRSRGDRISIVYRDRGVTPAGRAGFIERRCRVTASGHVSRGGPVPAQDMTLGAATPTPVPAPAPRVAGARLVDAHRRPLTLRGVNFSGAQYECLDDTRVWDVPADARALAALRRWRVNAVRLPLNEDCWLGINGKPLGRSAASYRQAIVRWVDPPSPRQRDRRLAQPACGRARHASLSRRGSDGRRRPRPGVLVVGRSYVSWRPVGAVRPLQRAQAHLMELLARRMPAPLRDRRHEQADRVDPGHRRDPARCGRRTGLRHRPQALAALRAAGLSAPARGRVPRL